jgi:hypothetical protein
MTFGGSGAGSNFLFYFPRIVACALAHDLGAGGIAGRRSSVAMLLGQAEFGGSVSHALQLERDKANVELLKA